MSDAPREFPFTQYPARQGFAWLAMAYRMFKVHRLAWVVLLLAYYVSLLLFLVIPYIGPYVMVLLKPVLAVGFLAAAWVQERGERPALIQLFQGFRANLWSLATIGLVFVTGITVAIIGSAVVDGGKLLELLTNITRMSEAQIASARTDPQLQLGMAFSALLSLPVVFATWWAPGLVVFQDARSGAALAASFRAALANWKSLAIYGAGAFFYGAFVPELIRGIATVVFPLPVADLLIVALLLPYSLFFMAIWHISDYVSYRDVFHAGETLTPLTAAGQG